MKEKKILLIDFDNNSLNPLKEFLQSKGYQIVIANDGKTAYNKCKSEEPELVIMEPMLPKLHGFELCSMIIKDFQGKIPIVILTKFYNKEQFKREAISSIGTSAFLRKPFKKEEILQTLLNIFGHEPTERHDLEKKEQPKKAESSKKPDIESKSDEDIDKKLQDVLSFEEIKSSKKTTPHEIDNKVDEMLEEILSKFHKSDLKEKSYSPEEKPEDMFHSFENSLNSSEKKRQESKTITKIHEHKGTEDDIDSASIEENIRKQKVKDEIKAVKEKSLKENEAEKIEKQEEKDRIDDKYIEHEQKSTIFKEFDSSKQSKLKTIFKNKTFIAICTTVISISVAAIVYTLFIQVSDNKKAAPPSLATGFIELVKQKKIDYEGVSITIDDSPILFDTNEPKEIQAGTHELKVKKGDRIFTKKIKILERKTNKISIPLLPVFIDIQPDGEIWEGDNLIRESNKSHVLYLLPMEYTFVFKKDVYQDEIKTIKLDENSSLASIQIQLNRLISIEPGTLSIQLLPSGKVYEEGTLLTSFPPYRQNIRLSPDQHTLKFTSSEEGCKDQIKTFQIISGKIENVIIYMCFGYLNINSNPPGGAIIIDNSSTNLEGKEYGTTPRARIKLPSGLHTITIKHPNHPEKSIQFVTKNNETLNLSIDLTIK
jgi:DNA-binding response OmpR family regulator